MFEKHVCYGGQGVSTDVEMSLRGGGTVKYVEVDRCMHSFKNIPWGKLVLFFHVFHDLLQGFLLLDVQAVA